jgi:hypothetical protein
MIDPVRDPAGLLVRAGPSGADGTAGPIAGDRVPPAGGVGRPPAADRLRRHPEQVGAVDFGESPLDAAQGAEAKRLEDLIGQLASVW